MHEQITALGWAWHGGCGCAGGGNLYKKADLTLRHYYKRGTWDIRRRGRRVDGGFDGDLIEKIKAL